MAVFMAASNRRRSSSISFAESHTSAVPSPSSRCACVWGPRPSASGSSLPLAMNTTSLVGETPRGKLPNVGKQGGAEADRITAAPASALLRSLSSEGWRPATPSPSPAEQGRTRRLPRQPCRGVR